jgi:hypothetical protein
VGHSRMLAQPRVARSARRPWNTLDRALRGGDDLQPAARTTSMIPRRAADRATLDHGRSATPENQPQPPQQRATDLSAEVVVRVEKVSYSQDGTRAKVTLLTNE